MLGSRTIIFYPPGVQIEPELMYKAADHIVLSARELLGLLGVKDEHAGIVTLSTLGIADCLWP